jgi:ABC-type multidrug transport system fused ATPase/permease subunit
MVGEELRRLLQWEERHRRLAARLIIAATLTVLVDLVGALIIWNWESGLKGSDIHGFGDAVFFSTVQVLTVSSSMKNPLTAAGKVTDVALELWALAIVTAVAGSFSSFFTSGDK